MVVTRSENMRRIKSGGTAPEMKVRRALHAAGLRYLVHDARLPGRPDIVLPSRMAVVEVRGCMWHQHPDPGCKRANVPKSRLEYWIPKLARNVERDRRNEGLLQEAGWTVIVVWECELRRPGVLDGLVGSLHSMPRLPRRRQKPLPT